MDNKEFNELLLQKFTEDMQDETGSIPEHLAETFTLWLQSKVKEASALLATANGNQEAPSGKQ